MSNAALHLKYMPEGGTHCDRAQLLA